MGPIEKHSNQLQKLSCQEDSAAQTELGITHLERMICTDDYVALELLKQAASKGNTEAKFRLGMMYSNGRGTSPSKSTALYWYKQAALEGHPDAAFALEARTSKKLLLSDKIHILDLAETDISLQQLTMLANSIVKTAIKALHLKGNKLGDEAVKVLAIYLKGSKVRTLDLWKNQVGSPGLIYLADALKELQLEILDLAENQIDDAGVIQLAGKLSDASLHTLHLGNNRIGCAGAKALSKQLPHTRLKVLDIGKNKLKESGINALLCQFNQSKLQILDIADNTKKPIETLQINLDGAPIEHLDLKLNRLDDGHICEFSKTFQRSRVCALNLRDNFIGPRGAIALARSLPFTLKLLNLRGNPIKDDGAIALAEAIKGTLLEILNLSGCGIGSEGFQKILDTLPESEVHTLNLGGNHIGEIPFRFKLSTKLKSLDLAGNGLGVQNGIGLGESLKNSALENCDFSGNRFGKEGMKSIFCNLPLTLKVLNISSNEAGPLEWDSMFRHLLKTQITQLVLSNNGIGNHGLKLISKHIKQVPLESFYLDNNGIDIDGIAAFALCMPTSLQILNCNFNPIGDEGLQLILKDLPNTRLHTLMLSHCGISDKGAEWLLNANLHTVILNGNNISATMIQRLKEHFETGKTGSFSKNNKTIPLGKRDLSLVVPEDYSLENLQNRIIEIMGKNYVFIDHIAIIEEVYYGDLVEQAKLHLGIQENQKNLVIRIFFKSDGKLLTKQELNLFSDILYKALNCKQK